MNRFRKLKIVLYLTILFLAGMGTGVFVSFQVVRHMMPSEARMTDRWSKELQSKLNLSPEQMQKIGPIIRETIGGFRRALAGDALSALSDSGARITNELTPEQKVKFEKLEDEQRGFIQRKLGGQTALAPTTSGTN
jgi:Spy/CpxP family protein refolding chaperone